MIQNRHVDVVGWGMPRIVSAVVNTVQNVAQQAVDVVQNVTQTVQDVASAAYESEIFNMIQTTVEVTIDTAQQAQSQYSDIKDSVQETYANTGIKAFVDASKPLLSELDKLARDIPLAGDLYSTARNTIDTTMAVIETARAYYELYAGELPEAGVQVVDDIKAMINQYFAFLGWY